MAEEKPPFLLDRRGKRVVITFTEATLTGREPLAEMFRRLDEILNMTPDPRFVLNFARVNHISSVFIGLLMGFRKRVDERKGSITLIGINEQVMEVLHLTRIDQNFTIRESAPSLDDSVPGLPPQQSRRRLVILLAAGAVLVAMTLVWLLFFQ